MYKLRDYQKRAVEDSIQFLNNSKNSGGMCVLPVAAGKSLIIAEVAKSVGGNCIVLQPSIELLKQNHNKAINLGVENIKIFSAGVGLKDLSSLTFATLGSLKSVVEELIRMGVDTVLIDEVHFKFSESPGGEFKTFLRKLNPKKILGFTATPYKLINTRAGSKLTMLNRIPNKFIQEVVHVTQPYEMVKGGYWTPISYEVYNFIEYDLELNSTGSDFTADSIRYAIESQDINNSVYKRVKKLLKDGCKSILVFVDSVETADKLSSVTPNSASISSKTKGKERERVIKDFLSGELKVVFNYGLLTTGFDYPNLECVILARPTNSLSLWTQIVGRGVRIFESKENFLMVDYCGNFNRFGGIEEQEVLNYGSYGWGVFSGEDLVTGVHIGLYSVKKENLDVDFKRFKDYTLDFGKFEGKKVSELVYKESGYLSYLLKEFDFDTPDKIEMQQCIINYLKYSALKS